METKVTEKKQTGLVWAARILYIITALIILREIIYFVNTLVKYGGAYAWVGDTSLVFYSIFIIALASQFKGLFLSGECKIKGNAMYLIALVMYISNSIFSNIYSISLSLEYGDSLMEILKDDIFSLIFVLIIFAAATALYFVIKKINKEREGSELYDSEENFFSKVKRIFKLIIDKRNENRM